MKKVKRGRRGQHFRAKPDDLRDEGVPAGPVRIGTSYPCELCGGPVVQVGGEEDSDGTEGRSWWACLACRAPHVVMDDNACPICAAANN